MQRSLTENNNLHSAVEPFRFRGRTFYIKRDDQIDPLLSGNKYRKLFSLIKTPSSAYHTICSYGGTQSNAMLSLAALCHQKGWQFEYTCKTVPSRLKEQPTGNLKMALELGMKLIEVTPDDYSKAVEALNHRSFPSDTLFVRQGGADPLAKAGVEVLADEIRQWQSEEGIETLSIVTPSGTGTTAFYLADAMPENRVYTSAVVGDALYLSEQMQLLGTVPRNLRIFEMTKKYPFAKPHRDFLAMYEELKESGIEFDLIYGVKMWCDLIEHIDEMETPILYIHSGGIIGNTTMLERYAYKGMR